MKTPHQHIATITQADVAERSGFSQITVSRALSNDPRVRPETAAHIHAIATEMGYSIEMQSAARRMVLKRQGRQIINRTIALYFPNYFQNIPYFNELFRGVMDAATDAHFGLLTCYQPTTIPSHESDLPPSFQRNEVDGMVIFPTDETMPLINALRQSSCFGDRPLTALIHPLERCTNVIPNERQGAYDAVRHLLALGHRHIAQMSMSDVMLPKPGDQPFERYTGACQAMSEFGLDPERHLYHLIAPVYWLCPSRYWEHTPAVAPIDDPPSEFEVQRLRNLTEFIQAHPHITAIMAYNDVSANRLREHLQTLGMHVPRDMSIVGFDDIDPMLDDNNRNILTTVHVPLAEISRLATELTIQQVMNQVTDTADIKIATEFVQRGSTTVAPKR